MEKKIMLNIFYRKSFILLFILLLLTSCGKSRLIEEIEKGNIANVKILISQGKKVNFGYRKGVTPLMIASRDGQLEIVKLLLDNGAEVNKKSKYDWTPIMFTIHPGYLDIARLLIKNGADVNIKTKEVPGAFSTTGGIPASTPLAEAAGKGHFEMVKLLVENGAVVHAMKGYSFINAAWGGHLDIMKYLLKHGTDINSGDDFHSYPIIVAATIGHLDTVKWLVQNGADVNVSGYSDTALLSAADKYYRDKEKYFPVIKYLVENGADVNVCNSINYTALMKVLPDIEMVKYLIENGAKIGVSGHRRNEFSECESNIERIEEDIAISKKKGEDIVLSDIERLNKYREVLKYLESVRGSR